MDKEMRVAEHPVLGEASFGKEVVIYFDGRPVPALEGEPVAAALLAAGIRAFRRRRNAGSRAVFSAQSDGVQTV